jgi:GNAT superfamily N-acetyltransferase
MTAPMLRDAGPADLDAVVRVFLACFRVTYAARLPSQLAWSVSDEEARSLWSRTLTTPGRKVVVAQVDDEVRGVVGFAADGEEGWVNSLYVAPDAQGRGLGSTLLGHAADRLRKAGCHRAYLWVFAENEPSVRFYGRHGWTPDGATRVEEAFGENEIRLARSLEAAG